MVQRQLPNELLDYIVDLLLDDSDLDDAHERVLVGGRLALANKRLVPLGRRLSWSRTVIVCNKRNLEFAKQLAHDSRFKHLLPLIVSLEFKQPTGASADEEWAVRMVEVAEACTDRLEVLLLGRGLEHQGVEDWYLSFSSRDLLMRIVRSPMASSLFTLSLRVVFGSNLNVLDLSWAVKKCRGLAVLCVRSKWEGLQLEHTPSMSGGEPLIQIHIHDDGMVGQPSLDWLLLPLIYPESLEYLYLKIHELPSTDLEHISCFYNLKTLFLDTTSGSTLFSAFERFLAVLANLPDLRAIRIGPSLKQVPLTDFEWRASPVPLQVVLDSISPRVQQFDIGGLWFIDNIGLKYFLVESICNDKFDGLGGADVRIEFPGSGTPPPLVRIRRRLEPDGTKTLGIWDETPAVWGDSDYGSDYYRNVAAANPVPPCTRSPSLAVVQ